MMNINNMRYLVHKKDRPVGTVVKDITIGAGGRGLDYRQGRIYQ